MAKSAIRKPGCVCSRGIPEQGTDLFTTVRCPHGSSESKHEGCKPSAPAGIDKSKTGSESINSGEHVGKRPGTDITKSGLLSGPSPLMLAVEKQALFERNVVKAKR